MVRTYAEKAGLPRVTPHLLRHCCATHMLARQAGLRHLQALLGHASPDTTQLYTKVEISDLREVHRQVSSSGVFLRAIEEFLRLKSAQLKPSTVTQYRRYLGVFRSFCQSLQIHELRELKQEHLNAYRLHLHQALNARGQPLSSAHLAITLSKLRGFLSWALERWFVAPRVQEPKRFRTRSTYLPPFPPWKRFRNSSRFLMWRLRSA